MAIIAKIKKRNGQIVDFNPEKITIAVKKAFLAVLKDEHASDAGEITRLVVEQLSKKYEGNANVPGVEEIQDIVENALMQRGYWMVAKSYIIYRYEHTKKREEEKQELIRKIAEKELSVVKRDGRKEVFLLEKIKKTLAFAAADQPSTDVNSIASQCQLEVYDGITTKEIEKVLVMVTRSMIERDPAYSTVAARLLLNSLHTEAIGAENFDYKHFDRDYRAAFTRNIKRAVELKKLDPRMLEYDLDGLSGKLRPERDDLLKYLGLQTLNDRYFLTDPVHSRTLETPQYLFMRVAMGLALGEQDRAERALEFYEIMSKLEFVPSTPTLFHAGTAHPQLSSCYLNTVLDDLNHIFKVYSDNAQLSKWAGGIGTDWTGLRATGALIKTAGIHSQGVIPFLKIANDVTVAINRSGRRRGATCVYLEVWHYDFEDFLELRKNTGDERRRTHDMNTASWVPDLFMKRVRDDGDWTFFSPDETPELHHTYGKKFDELYQNYEARADQGKIVLYRRMKARDLWKKMLTMLFETGHPWITWKDPSNIRSPQDHVGVVHNSNLCTEIVLNTSEDETAVCNLGSVNFAKHMKDGAFDGEKIGRTVTTAMRMLDNVIDLNFYPTVEAKNSNVRHRPVGLGLMGFQDALYQLGIAFESREAVDFADRSMEIISYYALLASSGLARERGTYESYKGSKWDRGLLPVDTIALLEEERGEKIAVDRTERLDWSVVRNSIQQYGMRNSNCMAIAPTATISNISGSVPSIEPIYKNIYVKSNISGDFTVVNPYLIEDLKYLNLWDDEMLGKIKYRDGSVAEVPEIPERIRAKYKETFEIDMAWVIRAAAARGKWIDQSQSLNIFFRGKSGKELTDLYLLAWSLGLKTTYYLRTMAASQVEKSTVNASEYGSTHIREAKEGGPSVAAPSVVPPAETPLPAQAGAPAEPVIAIHQPSPISPASLAREPVQIAPVLPFMSNATLTAQANRASAATMTMAGTETPAIAAPLNASLREASGEHSAKQNVLAAVLKKPTLEKVEDAVCEACE